MANHGKRAPLARMSAGDGILIYSPITAYPAAEPLRAITFVGEVTGKEPEPSDVLAGGYRRAASLHEIDPRPLAQIREHLPVSRLRFSFFELDVANAEAIRAHVATDHHGAALWLDQLPAGRPGHGLHGGTDTDLVTDVADASLHGARAGVEGASDGERGHPRGKQRKQPEVVFVETLVGA